MPSHQNRNPSQSKDSGRGAAVRAKHPPSDRTGGSGRLYRAHISGIVHCPGCGEILWPPDDDMELVTDSGIDVDTPLASTPGDILWHRSCFDDELLGVESRYRIDAAEEVDTKTDTDTDPNH